MASQGTGFGSSYALAAWVVTLHVAGCVDSGVLTSSDGELCRNGCCHGDSGAARMDAGADASAAIDAAARTDASGRGDANVTRDAHAAVLDASAAGDAAAHVDAAAPADSGPGSDPGPCPPSGAVHVAASLSFADVSAAVSAAAEGDTVLLPAGSATWTATLTIPRAITLRGAGSSGSSVTRIDKADGTILELAPERDAPMRVTGIYLAYPAFSLSDRYAIHIGRPVTNLRIDRCRFDFGSRTVYGTALQVYGVLDHNYFYDPDAAIAVSNQGSSEAHLGDAEWARPLRAGTVSTFVIEDNEFVRDARTTSDPNEIVYGQGASRVTFRHNTVTQTAISRPLAAIDAHGYFNIIRGTRLYEVYANTFHATGTYRFCNLRGGTMIFFDNTFITDDGSSPDVFQLKNEGVSSWGSYDSRDVISDSFFWNNTLNGRPVTGVSIESGSGPYVVENTNYFLRAPRAGDRIDPYVPLSYPHPRVVAEDSGACAGH